MQKISSRDAAALLKQAGSAIRDVVKENQELREKLSAQDHNTRVVKLARDMEEKGLMGEHSLAEKVAHLRKVDKLEVTEEAVKLAAPQSQADLLGGLGDASGSGGEHPFVTFIETGEDAR